MTARLVRVLFAVAAGAAAALAHAQGTSVSGSAAESLDELGWPAERGFAIQLDNDLFSGAHRDEDYSWGAAVTFSSPETRRWLRPIDGVRERIVDWVTPSQFAQEGSLPGRRAVQIGIIGMTPETLKSPDPLINDRPFASLLFINSGELQVLESGRRARFSSLTLGMLGLKLAEDLHRGVHKLVGDERPLGWDHQISAGGEPTARYMQAEQWLLRPVEPVDPGGPELKLTAAGSAGFLTEASVALSARWGRIQTPWWSFNPELADYIAAPVPPMAVINSRGLTELYGFAGVRVKARAYNALLQGQFRHSDVRIHSNELARLQSEAWIGIGTRWSDWRMTYTIRYASRETTREPAARSLIWAGVSFERTF